MEFSEQEFRSVLKAHHCLEASDVVSDDPVSTYFRRRARLHQALWSEDRGFKIGSQPMRKQKGRKSRPLGSRIDLDFAIESKANFLHEEIWNAVKYRIDHPQAHQTLNKDRLFCDLLSSMPMCFNLFGILAHDLELADRSIHAWWPNVPGRVCAVHFEWSPGRMCRGEFLENRSTFDVAFEVELEKASRGILGIETKYHELCKKEKAPSDDRQKNYNQITARSGIISSENMEKFIGSDLQQIWLDHLLALSMLQHPSKKWTWAGFVLVHPAKNQSYVNATKRYRVLLADSTSFHVSTLESLLAADVLPKEIISAFTERYIW